MSIFGKRVMFWGPRLVFDIQTPTKLEIWVDGSNIKANAKGMEPIETAVNGKNILIRKKGQQ